MHLSRTEILAEKGVLNNSGRFLKCPFVKKVSPSLPKGGGGGDGDGDGDGGGDGGAS